MLKKILYSPFTKKIYDQIKNIPALKNVLDPIANKASLQYLANTKKKLDEISPSFCSAKWLQSTLHLELGETHSCHHPTRHRVDISEVEKDPSRLHNTKQKEEYRKQMIKGFQPAECEYCWRVEKNNDYSDRIYKSAADWAQVDLKKLTTSEQIKNVNPTYLEISFSSDCNLKCAYCSPEVSSAIRTEIMKYGPYPTTDNFGNLEKYQKSQVDLSLHFWKWWEQGLADDLKVLRITGGEPFLSKDLFKLIDFINQGEKSYGFELSINTNLMIGNDLLKKFLNDMNQILVGKKIKNFQLYTSIDTWGEHAEFLRHGLSIKKFVQNIETCLTLHPALDLTFMITYQALSPFQFNQLLEFILDLRKRFPKSRIKADISNLIYPDFLSIHVLDKSFLPAIAANLEFMKSNQLSKTLAHGFSRFEIQHLERIYHAFENQSERNENDRKNLKKFLIEYQQRKNVNFNEVFANSFELLSFINEKASD